MRRIEYTDIAERTILKLDKPLRLRILDYMRERVETANDPKMLAEPLTGEFRGLGRFRVSDYRVICDIQTNVRVAEVQDVGHRGDVYRKFGR